MAACGGECCGESESGVICEGTTSLTDREGDLSTIGTAVQRLLLIQLQMEASAAKLSKKGPVSTWMGDRLGASCVALPTH